MGSYRRCAHGTRDHPTSRCTYTPRAGRRENSASFSAALTSLLVSHLTVHPLATAPSRHYPSPPTRTQIGFSLPTSHTSSLFNPFICAVGYRGRASPRDAAGRDVTCRNPRRAFPPALVRFDTCVWAAARPVWLPRQTWPGHRCLSPPPLPSLHRRDVWVPPMESLHFTIMLLPSLCGALILSHQSQKLALHGQRSDYFSFFFFFPPQLFGFEVNPALGRASPPSELWIPAQKAGFAGDLPRGQAHAGGADTPGYLSLATQGARTSPRPSPAERGAAAGALASLQGLRPVAGGGVAVPRLISPEVPWHAVPTARDYRGPTDPGITLQASPQQHPSKIQGFPQG